MKVFFSAAGGLPRPLSDPPWPPLWPPKATPSRPQSSPVLRFSDPTDPQSFGFFTLSFDFRKLYWCCIDTVSIQHQYSLQKSKDRVTKPSDRGLWGRKTEAQASFGVDPGSLRGDPGVTLGGQREVGGGRRRPNFFFHFRRFKIMKLCGNLNLLWKRLEID